MKKYNVKMKRAEFGFIEVEANNEAEAEEKARELEMQGDMAIMNSEIEHVEIESLEPLEELSCEDDIEFMMEFRSKHWTQWAEFCKGKGYKAEVTE